MSSFIPLIVPLSILLLFLVPLFTKTNSEIFKILSIISIILFVIGLNIFILLDRINMKKESLVFLYLSIIYLIISIYFFILYSILSGIENDKNITKEEERICKTEKVGIVSSFISSILILASAFSSYVFYISINNRSRERSNAFA